MTYAALKSDVAAWLDRDDLTAQIPSFVRLVEARIARDVRVNSLSSTSTITVLAGDSSTALPSNFVELRGVAGDWVYLTPTAMQQAVAVGAVDYRFTVTGGLVSIGREAATDTDLTLTYYAKPDALTGDADTNAILSDHYGLYLFGALAEACVFLSDDARAPLFEAKYRKALEDLRTAEAGAYFSNAELPGLNVV